MKTLLTALIAGSCFAIPVAMAQDSAPDADAAAAETEDRELTRAERRALRQAEREAEREESEAHRASEAVAVADDSEDSDEDGVGLICRRESVVGSHRRVRICTTRAEREAARESAREVLRDVTRPTGDFGTEGAGGGL